MTFFSCLQPDNQITNEASPGNFLKMLSWQKITVSDWLAIFVNKHLGAKVEQGSTHFFHRAQKKKIVLVSIISNHVVIKVARATKWKTAFKFYATANLW